MDAIQTIKEFLDITKIIRNNMKDMQGMIDIQNKRIMLLEKEVGILKKQNHILN
jgi:hypothetical protein